MTTTVWSERGETYWRDCWVCGYLMTLSASGFGDFPLGLNTVAEREAFERSQTMFPPEKGGNNEAADQASMKRYGRKLVTYDLEAHPAALSVAGKAYAVPGRMGNFPDGHDLRRWDKSFAGNHQVCVLTLGGGKARWLDPLAPMGFVGDVVPVSDVVTFMAGRSDVARAASIAEEDMLGIVTDMESYRQENDGLGRRWATKPGTVLNGYDPARPGKVVISRTWTVISGANADALVAINWPDTTPQPVPKGSGFLHVTNGIYKGLYIVAAMVTIASGPSPADCTEAVSKAVAATKAAAHLVPSADGKSVAIEY
jgi:hypothetical protein